jgi:hypothetical protein
MLSTQDSGDLQDKNNWGPTLKGLHAAMMDYQIDFAVVMPQADLDRYALLILPGNLHLDEAARERVRRFVAQGGKLLAFGGAGAGLQDVLGIEAPHGEVFPYTALFAGLQAPQLRRSMLDYPVLMRGGAIRTRATTGTSLAKVIIPIAEYTPQTAFGWGYNPPGEQTDYDMIVRNRYGKGEAIYVAGSLSEDLAQSSLEQNGAIWLKQLTANLIDALFPDRLVVAEATPGIELVTNWQADRLIVNLINYHAVLPGRYALNEKRMIKASGITLRVNEARFGTPARVLMQPGNRELSWVHKDGWLEVQVPDFLIHTFVIVEKY